MQRASREAVRAMMPESIQLYREKFTSRLEAISDLVLGFSLRFSQRALMCPQRLRISTTRTLAADRWHVRSHLSLLVGTRDWRRSLLQFGISILLV